MDSLLPPFFALAASLALIAALTFLWRSLRAAFGAADSFHLPSAEAESRRILEERKTALLSNLADLEFEHAGDKISDEDYEALDKKLRAEAKRVLRLLDDDVKPYRAKAEKRLKGYLSERGAPYREQADKPLAKEQSATSEASESEEAESNEAESNEAESNEAESNEAESNEAESNEAAAPEEQDSKSLLDHAIESGIVENACLKCDTVNDADAAFCKKCGSAMGEDEPNDAGDSARDEEDAP